jgi:hypothetical protein
MLRLISSTAPGWRSRELSLAPQPNWQCDQCLVYYCDHMFLTFQQRETPYISDEGQCIAITIFEITE